MTTHDEGEWKTRKKRIDPRLDAQGWKRGQGASSPKPHRTEEHATQNGPADYVLWHDRNIVACTTVGARCWGLLSSASHCLTSAA